MVAFTGRFIKTLLIINNKAEASPQYYCFISLQKYAQYFTLPNILTKYFCVIKNKAYLCRMKTRKGRPVGTKVGRRNIAKILFREEWNALFSRLTDSEKKIYPTILQTTAKISGLCVPTTKEIYHVRANRNNKNYAVLEPLRLYVQSKPI